MVIIREEVCKEFKERQPLIRNEKEGLAFGLTEEQIQFQVNRIMKEAVDKWTVHVRNECGKEILRRIIQSLPQIENQLVKEHVSGVLNVIEV